MRALAWFRDRPALAAGALYVLLALVLFSAGLVPGRTLTSTDYLWSSAPWEAAKPERVRVFGANPETADQSSSFIPFLEYSRAELGGGVPLWNPHIMGGRPYLANAQSALFSPFSVPAYVLPFYSSFGWIALLKVLTAAFGAYLLARALAMRFPGAFLCGLVFGFGLFFLVWIPWPLSSVWAFIPWLLLLTDRLVRRPGVLPVAGLSAVIALQFFGGHPESSFHALFAAVAFLALRLWQVRRGSVTAAAGILRPALLFGAALTLGAALAAVAILPFVELLARSADVVDRVGQDPTPVQRRFLFAMILSDYYGRPTQLPIEGLIVERAFYVGALTLLLAAAALIVRPTLERIAVAAFAAFSLAMVFGVQPLFAVVREVPGFELAHNTRFTILYLVSTALLAGWGLDSLLAAQPSRARRDVLSALAVAALLVPVALVLGAGRSAIEFFGDGLEVAWGFESPPFSHAITIMGSLIVWVTFASAALALLVLRLRGRLGTSAFALFAVALIAADLFRAGMGQNPGIPLDHARQPSTGAIRYLQGRAPARFAGATPVERVAPIVPDVSMRYGLYDARGYDYPIERRYDRLWQRTVEPVTPFAVHTVRTPINERSLRTLSLLGVADVIQRPADPPLSAVGLRLAYDEPDARVYANERALPRTWMVNAQRVVTGEEAALRTVSGPGFDPREEAVVERALPGLSAAGRSGGASPGSARLSLYEPERVVVQAEATRPGLVVLNDVHYPGWKATVDGEAVDIERVDYLLRGVRVPAGRHRVEMTYAPLTFRIGWIVSLLTLLGMVVAVALELRRRRHRPA